MLTKIVSGAQTGVDRGALDAALDLGFAIGGWVPKGRLAEDGTVPEKYRGLAEMPNKNYLKRTERNVIDSDGTLVLCSGAPTGGTKRTVGFAAKHGKPCLVKPLDSSEEDIAAIVEWIASNGIESLNVAGPRGSKCPEAQAKTKTVILAVLRRLGNGAADAKRKEIDYKIVATAPEWSNAAEP